jgi:hypothetical protein
MCSATNLFCVNNYLKLNNFNFETVEDELESLNSWFHSFEGKVLDRPKEFNVKRSLAYLYQINTFFVRVTEWVRL